jgi:hypothetical protein
MNVTKMCSSKLLCVAILFVSFVEGAVHISKMTRTVFRPGETVLMNCSNNISGSHITWSMKPSGSTNYKELYEANVVVEEYETKYSVESSQPQQWTLSFVISDSRFACQYRCCDEEGCKQSDVVSLSVFDIDNSACSDESHQSSKKNCYGYIAGKCEPEIQIPRNLVTHDPVTINTVDFICNCSLKSEIRSNCVEKEMPKARNTITPKVINTKKKHFSGPDNLEQVGENNSVVLESTHPQYILMIMFCYTLSHVI